jgi:hypothetical protein
MVGASTQQRNVHWLMAYALGVAFSVPSDAAACAQILAVTTERRELMEARARLGSALGTDAGTRRRAAQLLSRAVRFVDESSTADGPASARPA